MREKNETDPMGAHANRPTRQTEPQPSSPQATAAVTVAWIRALASDWTERREIQESARPDSRRVPTPG